MIKETYSIDEGCWKEGMVSDVRGSPFTWWFTGMSLLWRLHGCLWMTNACTVHTHVSVYSVCGLVHPFVKVVMYGI